MVRPQITEKENNRYSELEKEAIEDGHTPDELGEAASIGKEAANA
ncbi:MAG TPA: hypothetical protein PK874_08935 [Desulfobacteraceae bacterium]|nr:hypothetical protein [Desulfobacteraceae bacterium]HPJ67806.1 hypothetical protein [Desulfobacteraceae bacterium]HPQ28036.1 hypothetical protein [Desulfobacteraceae bacterium]